MQSEQINELMTALAKAQGQMSYAVKDSTNPHFRNKYADLASIWQACREALSNNGLAVTQTLDFAAEKQILVTTLGHVSGQWMKSFIALPIQKPGPQEIVSCITYCRRASLAAIVGVYQDDDDGELAQEPYREQNKGPKISEDQKQMLNNYLHSFPDASKGICEKYNLADVYDLPASQFFHVIDILKKRLEAKEKKHAK